jgi:hypothetical protein
MKVHQTADGQLCRCAWCAPRLEAFRERRMVSSLEAAGADYALMLDLSNVQRHPRNPVARAHIRAIADALAAQFLLTGSVAGGHPWAE